MNVIAVRLAMNHNLEGGSELHQMLETLFSSKMTVQEQAEKRFGQLISALLKDGLTEVVERVAVDEEVRAEYYKKYNIQ